MAIAADGVAAGLPAWRVRRVTEHIEHNLDKPLPLTELAAVVYMSRFHFARLFRRSTGDPPHRFVIRQRITCACEFLARSELTIAEISRRVGFRTPSHFTTMFRRVSGVTPRGYRIEHARDVWKETARSTSLDNVIDVHIARLRRKVDADSPVKLIQTVRGVGFMLREEEA